MSRGLDRTDDREPVVQTSAQPLSDVDRRPLDADVRRSRERGQGDHELAITLPDGRWREAVASGDRVYRLRDSESRALEAVATFRVVLERDLADGVYHGDRRRMGEDLRSLREQGLIDRQALAASRRGGSQGLVALTPAGHRLMRDHRGSSELSEPRPNRPEMRGFGRRSDLVHNASLYRMFQVEAARLHGEGAHLRRVWLDEDLKRALYRDLQAAGTMTTAARRERLAELATEHDLHVVDGHVQLPDVRLEYETAAGERGRVDLELATDHYRAGQLAAKQQAGFTVYSTGGRHGRSLGGGTSGGAPAQSWDPSYLSGLLSL
jgi:hypothetical protein